MQIIFILLAALFPVVITLYYIIKKDSERPEPSKWLVKAFCYGLLSAFLSFFFSVPANFIFGLDFETAQYHSVISAFSDAFLLAAIPEELAKFIMLWLLLRKNTFYDEKFDGIVYSVCIGMGFAAIENVMYLFNGTENGLWISIGISRALFSIPGHYVFAVLMGYYYSIYHFNISRSKISKIMILAAPILAHGIFDGILYCVHINEAFSLVCTVAFLFFFRSLKKRGNNRINTLLNS